MRGRYPSGPEFVEHLNGSAEAKRRLTIVLETLAGMCRVGEACERLGISEQRFDQIRIEAMQAGVDRLEPRPAGRPATVPTRAEFELQQARARLAELEAALHAAGVRTEIALTLPQATASAEKKTPPSQPRDRKARMKKSS
jgi:Helix-turn-helix domain